MAWEWQGDSYRLKISDDCALLITAEQNQWGQTGTATLILVDEATARDNLEEPLQLLEGCGYSYELTNLGYEITASEIFRPHPRKKYEGRITPGIYVGRLAFEIKGPEGFNKSVAVEVRSVKAEYRSEYRTMLEDITSRCTDLLMIHSSPVTQSFSVDHENDAKTIYQRFAFVKSIVDSDEFRNAVHRVISMPVTAWKHIDEERDIRRAGRIGSAQIRQIASQSDRIPLPDGHPLRSVMQSVPTRLIGSSKMDSVDTPENRFVKHALQVFQSFCGMVCAKLANKKEYQVIHKDACSLEEQLADYLNHSLFREVSVPKTLPLNSPVLQRKEGYREILRTWLMFDLAAKLSWNALDDDQYHAGKRDVATLYEYWVFFKLLDVVSEVFTIEPNNLFDDTGKNSKALIVQTADKMGLQLRQGRHVALEGKTVIHNRECAVKFHYNRTFGKREYPAGGSWTQQMRPDYTLSIWPSAFTETDAEMQELIVHIHFDAKYKVEGLKYLLGGEVAELPENFDELPEDEQLRLSESLNREKQSEKEGTYKRADLLKMHAYKDAIRRTAGAYVIYPGSTSYQQKGFHEIIPGLGAFPLSPSMDNASQNLLTKFIRDVAEHFANRASQREEISFYNYQVHKNYEDKIIATLPIPEKLEHLRIPPAKEISVLVGFFRKGQEDWIFTNQMYNVRVSDKDGLVKYGKRELEATYLILYSKETDSIDRIYKINSENPRLISNEYLVGKGYPEPSCDHYLLYDFNKTDYVELGYSLKITAIKKLAKRKDMRPFAITMDQLFALSESN